MPLPLKPRLPAEPRSLAGKFRILPVQPRDAGVGAEPCELAAGKLPGGHDGFLRSVRHDRVAAGMLAPYAGWVAFATALTAAIAQKNPPGGSSGS